MRIKCVNVIKPVGVNWDRGMQGAVRSTVPQRDWLCFNLGQKPQGSLVK